LPETNSSIQKSITHYPQLDGLRGIAILMVILFHYFPDVAVLRFGWAGVDLFFVLSGFLISSRLIPFINEQGILKRFYRNRFLRIVPLYFTFLSVFFLIWFLFVSKATIQQNPFYTNYWWSFFLFIQNWVYIFNLQQPIDYLNHFWSLAAEEQFYLAFPIFVLLFRKPKKILLVAIFIISLVLLTRVIYFYFFNAKDNFQTIYWNTFFRADSFLAGSILFILLQYYRAQKRYFLYLKYAAVISVVLLAGGVYYYKSLLMSNPFFETFGYTLIPILFSYILFKSIEGGGKFLNKITSFRALKYCGKISYGLYIFHWPVYLSGYAIMNKMFKNDSGISATNLHLIIVTLSIVFTFAICHLSFKNFESYFLKLKAN
jgi:peptidoglycan/LPS O-acetylase OafA/YrhL